MEKHASVFLTIIKSMESAKHVISTQLTMEENVSVIMGSLITEENVTNATLAVESVLAQELINALSAVM